MDDSCAVCADNLEWVAYGPCGHKDVCSTCVARLRFICNDRRCCICKAESNSIFVTKALGDYTRNVSDFSVFPSQLKEGQVGSYWCHEGTRAFFDDPDHYKMIKAMCRLSCSICDNEEPPNDDSRRRTRFRNIEQLKGHLFHHHMLVMCSLCLEGRKVFICEQKLYTRAQLNQHISTGDTEVDGSESERGGFTGHPFCEFCVVPFYGDNELYTHMSTEHYTCHICQRQHPGQYEYYKNYDDLENHFRGSHFLCEDESCLAKKFIVFPSEAELKRHNTLEHGGRMSRCQRNAALQIPTSFRYRRYNEQENRRGRGRTFRRDTSGTELSMAIQASLETANSDQRIHDASLSSIRVASDQQETRDVDPLLSSFESLVTTDSETSARYLQAVSQNARTAPIEESSFPPLPTVPSGSQQMSQPDASVNKSMAARLRHQNNRTSSVLRSSTARPAAARTAAPPVVTPPHAWPALSNASSSGQTKKTIDNESSLSSYSSPIQVRQALISESLAAGSSGPSRNWGSARSISHSVSAPSLFETGSFSSSASDFPPVSIVQAHKSSGSGQARVNAEDIHTANKSLVERIRIAINFDEDKYTAFKNISGKYRQGLMDAETYLVYVGQFGLSDLVLELARLCPDPQKQKALVDMYTANMSQQNVRSDGIPLKYGTSLKRGKGKSPDSGSNSSKDDLADNFLSTIRQLQMDYKPSEDDVEILLKDGYRGAKGNSKVAVDETKAEAISRGDTLKLRGTNSSMLGVGDSSQTRMDTDRKSKHRKKTSKFHRLRLGNDSAEATSGTRNLNSDPDQDPKNKRLGGSQQFN